MANKKAVLTKPMPDASLPRNAFDRESMRAYHYALGQLIPAWWEPVTAGTHMKLNRKIFQRTANLNTAAFPIMDTHIQYYFVPTRLMWSLWDNFRLGISDIESTGQINIANDMTVLGTTTMPNRVPYTDLADIMSQLSTWSGSPATTDVHGDVIAPSAQKLLNFLGYGNPAAWAPTVSGEVNLWPLLAYQKIYFDHFRNTSFENNNPRCYNMDYLWAQNRSMKLPATELANLLTLRYVNYRNDYFNNIYPSLNYVQSTSIAGSAGALTPGNNIANSIGLPSSLVGVSNNFFGNQFGVDVNSNNASGVFMGATPVSAPYSTYMSVQTIRAAFALDKLLRSSAYTPQHVKDQYEARYDIKYKGNTNHSVFIGAFKNDIQIGEVTSTADTGSSGLPLGTIGGKGVSFDDWSKTLEFNAQEDGIVMAIQYTTIRSCYRSLGLDSFLRKALPEDYFVPEYQNLGLEPVYGEELSLSLGQTTVPGFRPRNQRYKLGIDKSYGLFSDVSTDMSHFINHTDVGRLPSVGQSGVGFNWFKVNPHDLDSIMSVIYDGSWSTDQFFGQTIFGATMIQNMSVHGQPSL